MNTSFIREFAFSVAPAPAPPPPILDPVALDALALCVSGLSFKKSRLDVDVDEDMEPNAKRIKTEPLPRPRRIPNSSILHHRRPRPSRRRAAHTPAVVPVVVTITELVVTLHPTLDIAQQDELASWNARCIKARSHCSQHAPRPAPVYILVEETTLDYRNRMAWNTHCDRARSDLSPHAPGASSVNVVAVAPPTSTSSPVVATFSSSNVAAPTSSSAKGKERAVDAVSAISDVGAAALGDITNADADTRRRSKRGKGKDNLGGGVRKAPKNNTTGRAKSTAGVKSIFAAAINDMVDEYDGIHLRGNGVKVDMGGGGGGRSDSILDAGTDSTFAAARKDSTDAGPRLHGRPKDNKTLREYLLRSTLKKKMKAPSYFPGII